MKVRITLIALTISSFALGQQLLKVEGTYNFGYHHNVFNSPNSYLKSGNSVSKDSLVQNDIFNDLTAKFDFRKRYNNNTFRYRLNGNVKRFIKVNKGNESVFGGTFIYTHHLNKMNLSGELLAQRNKRLGINVLGDELNKSFTYNKYLSEVILERIHNKKTESKLKFTYLFKDYDSVINEESLSHSEYNAQWSYRKESATNSKGKKVLFFDAGFRNRNYTEWKNTQLLDPNYVVGTKDRFLPVGVLSVYPLRIWRYYSSRIAYEIPLGKKIKVKPYFAYQYRTDNSDGDFTFSEIQPGIRAYFKSNDTRISTKLSYQIRNYRDRITEQTGLTNYPFLNYNYFRYALNFEQSFSKKWIAILDFNMTNRASNTSSEAKRTRRSYTNYVASIGIKYRLINRKKY